LSGCYWRVWGWDVVRSNQCEDPPPVEAALEKEVDFPVGQRIKLMQFPVQDDLRLCVACWDTQMDAGTGRKSSVVQYYVARLDAGTWRKTDAVQYSMPALQLFELLRSGRGASRS
jgi:hypothetical protein